MVERIMRQTVARGHARPSTPRTTEPDPAAAGAPDLVGRVVGRGTEPAGGGRLQPLPMTCGFGYTASVVDAYAGLTPGGMLAVQGTGFVERELRNAATFRACEAAGPTNHRSQ